MQGDISEEIQSFCAGNSAQEGGMCDVGLFATRLFGLEVSNWEMRT